MVRLSYGRHPTTKEYAIQLLIDENDLLSLPPTSIERHNLAISDQLIHLANVVRLIEQQKEEEQVMLIDELIKEVPVVAVSIPDEDDLPPLEDLGEIDPIEEEEIDEGEDEDSDFEDEEEEDEDLDDEDDFED